jgi:hypothetical protein
VRHSTRLQRMAAPLNDDPDTENAPGLVKAEGGAAGKAVLRLATTARHLFLPTHLCPGEPVH